MAHSRGNGPFYPDPSGACETLVVEVPTTGEKTNVVTTTRVSRTIAAAPAEVFDCVAHIERFREAVPHILDVEFLTESTAGTGARFRETRLMGKREATTELEVKDYDPPRLVRMVSDTGGAVWDTTFTVAPLGASSRLEMVMEARPHSLLARLTVPLFGRLVAKAVEADIDAVKDFCERED